MTGTLTLELDLSSLGITIGGSRLSGHGTLVLPVDQSMALRLLGGGTDPIAPAAPVPVPEPVVAVAPAPKPPKRKRRERTWRRI